ncbi:putative autophagy protein Atg13 [Aspergillus mulundensis]|uniref:Autophagy-related protein 13 n=1 Tax=Aspergillus mulundensis TaxID=1810919 RepID=A0A3D8RX69_9EURO|nr:Autophagy-related protein 13 [Aspergillus mulundensis]RDW78530.1 Autophagy-related protein 13 [Aspergillus mulundensis]
MHQHPRPPAPAAPSSSARRSQDYDRRSDSPAFDLRAHPNRGLGIETENDTSEPGQSSQPGPEAIGKVNQIVTNYHTKAALIILHSRVELPPTYTKNSNIPRVNRWFNVEIEETDALKDQLKTWRTCDATDNRPPPMIIETYLDTKGLTNNQTLVALDENGKRWDVSESLATSQSSHRVKASSANADEVILERWRVELGDMPGKLPSDLGAILPTVYKKSIILFRSLFTYSKFLPAWKFIKRNGRSRANPALRIKYRILSGQSQESSKPDHLTIPLFDGDTKVVDTYSFGVNESPAGPFSVQVTYRTSCDFRVDDSEALLSSRFMGADDEIFQPSLPFRGQDARVTNPEVGSVPLTRRTVEDPDLSRAYGSLSTFHHVGPTTGASPISALRAARESGASSPSPPTSSHRNSFTAARAGPVGRAATLANEANPNVARRPSISFQPFKAPPLSASPSLVDPPLGASPRTLGTGRASLSESRNMPPPSVAASARKPLASGPDNPLPSPSSASPRPAPISRYSSAFSHRRGRPSSGGINRLEDDTSSGKASATSSGAQPGSGLLAEITGTSADSIHADDENISEFLKMLDLRKDLLSPSGENAVDNPRRTTATSAALSRFRGMRDSNAALSDSMSSSMLMNRSSATSSKQLSGVPGMIAGTSTSTASSPGGKAISPHTPHTPAIPSRLSSHSIVDTTTRSHEDNGSPPEEDASDETTTERIPSTVTAIPIPTSPATNYPTTFRRSSSAANRRSTHVMDDDEIFTMRSVSLGAEEPSHTGLGTLQRQQEYQTAGTNLAPSESGGRTSRGDDGDVYRVPALRESGAHRGASTLGAAVASSPSSNHPLHQRRFSHSRGRGFSGGPHSLSSGSSSIARGGLIPPYLAEREAEREANPSASNSATEDRRGSGRRSSAGRQHIPPTTQVEEDEPLLFAMSDFGASRRSFEEGRQGNHGPDSSGNTNTRRGNGKRGGLSGFHLWP